jgi:hypothetical protein
LFNTLLGVHVPISVADDLDGVPVRVVQIDGIAFNPARLAPGAMPAAVRRSANASRSEVVNAK